MVAAVVVDPALVEGGRGEMKVVVVTTTAAGSAPSLLMFAVSLLALRN